MNKWIALGTATIPNGGGELKLSRREQEFSIRLSGIRGELMNSREHNSEEALAQLGCAGLEATENTRILVGGMGMGFTLAAALASVSQSAEVIVAELIPEVVEWNRGALGECAGHPLQDERTGVHIGDVAELLRDQQQRYDAILLDIDNGPEGLTHDDNQWLYSPQGLQAVYRALNHTGSLAVWSAEQNPQFLAHLKKAGFKASTHTVRARPGKGSRHTIFLANKNGARGQTARGNS